MGRFSSCTLPPALVCYYWHRSREDSLDGRWDANAVGKVDFPRVRPQCECDASNGIRRRKNVNAVSGNDLFHRFRSNRQCISRYAPQTRFFNCSFLFHLSFNVITGSIRNLFVRYFARVVKVVIRYAYVLLIVQDRKNTLQS